MIAYIFNAYVYMYRLFHMHPMNMCIHMIAHICIDCFANASNTYVYTFDCIDCFANAFNAYVYTY
jgi:hypothetical protein